MHEAQEFSHGNNKKNSKFSVSLFQVSQILRWFQNAEFFLCFLSHATVWQRNLWFFRKLLSTSGSTFSSVDCCRWNYLLMSFVLGQRCCYWQAQETPGKTRVVVLNCPAHRKILISTVGAQKFLVTCLYCVVAGTHISGNLGALLQVYDESNSRSLEFEVDIEIRSEMII